MVKTRHCPARRGRLPCCLLCALLCAAWALLAAGRAARADGPEPPDAEPAPKPAGRSLMTPWAVGAFGVVAGTLIATDRPALRLFDTDLGESPSERDRLPQRISFLGDGRTLLVASALPALWGGKHGRQATAKALKALATTTVAVTAVKYLVGKERPSRAAGRVRYRGPGLGDASFPSGHTAAAFAVATVMAHEYPRYRYLFWGIATAVGVARIQSAAHFPSDVWVGAGLGAYMGRRGAHGSTSLLSWSF